MVLGLTTLPDSFATCVTVPHEDDVHRFTVTVTYILRTRDEIHEVHVMRSSFCLFFFALWTKLLDTLLLTTTRLISPPFQEHGAHSRAEQTKRHVLSQCLPQRLVVLLLIHISQNATLSEAGRGVREERNRDTRASGGVGTVKTRAGECHKCQVSY
jgi:hypothetical protein